MELTSLEKQSSYFDGSTIEYIMYLLGMSLLSAITIGLAYPWIFCEFKRWEISHSVINGHRLSFNGRSGDLYFQYFKWIIFTIITLGIYGFIVPKKIKEWSTSYTSFVQ